MNSIDLIVFIALGIGIWKGWNNGLIKSLCSFVGFFVGLVVALLFYVTVGHQLALRLGEDAGTASLLAFLLIWIGVPIALNFAGSMLTKFINALYLGGLNSLAGAAFGLVKYLIGASLVLYLSVLSGLVNQQTVEKSVAATPMLSFVESFLFSFSESQQAPQSPTPRTPVPPLPTT